MADVLDIFKGDAFSIASLTHSINHADYNPAFLGSLGLFEEEGIPTTTVIIEEEYQTLKLVANQPYGGPVLPKSLDKRKARNFTCPHLPVRDHINAQQLQGLRAYASAMTPSQMLMAIEQMRDKKMGSMRMDIEATLEYHRIGAVLGKILDSDGTTVIYDLFTEFAVTQQVQTMILDTATTIVDNKIRAAVRLSQDALKNAIITGWVAICGDSFFDKFTGHAKVQDKFLNWQAAAAYSGAHRAYGSFEYGGVTWYNYRGSVGGITFVPSAKAYLFPLGVRGLFVGRFGPSDYIDRVNQIPSPDGLPIEARSWLTEDGKGLNLEAQSNPLYLCTKPRAVIELKENT